MQIYKEVKTYNISLQKQQSATTLEEKLDSEFLERTLTVYAFFTSCLNLVL
jgi:hypothetical protein